MKQININDDPTEDIICHLKDACDWIEKALSEQRESVENSFKRRNGMLVHCTQGISRSGAVVVAYCKFVAKNFPDNLLAPPTTGF